MVAGNVVVEEGVIAQHAVGQKMALPQPDIGGGAAVNMAQAELGKHQPLFGVIQRQQHIELAAVQPPTIIHIGLQFHRAVALQPVLQGLVGFTDRPAAQLTFGAVHNIAIFQHPRRPGGGTRQPVRGRVLLRRRGEIFRGIGLPQPLRQPLTGLGLGHLNFITGP
ncbi:hypothetical protein Xbed_03724 [Xenorhabdus beddingii]|uniref:Uncharacterized protein n=1 Tax=Xenorhabdus beddingii TaxID=40578 RepID=A0A1Y2S909_9GAMM|nr:hypothetical protein Xbed_03724 [Xenorhabdus beddingii]